MSLLYPNISLRIRVPQNYFFPHFNIIRPPSIIVLVSNTLSNYIYCFRDLTASQKSFAVPCMGDQTMWRPLNTRGQDIRASSGIRMRHTSDRKRICGKLVQRWKLKNIFRKCVERRDLVTLFSDDIIKLQTSLCFNSNTYIHRGRAVA
jgi:hypothetical protein